MRALSRRHLMAACAAIATLSIATTGILSMSDDASAQSGKPVTTASGLQMIDTQAGTGASPKSGQTAVVPSSSVQVSACGSSAGVSRPLRLWEMNSRTGSTSAATMAHPGALLRPA